MEPQSYRNERKSIHRYPKRSSLNLERNCSLQHKPEDIVDTTHHVSPKMKLNPGRWLFSSACGNTETNSGAPPKPRIYVNIRGIKFAEDLSKEDREACCALWPRISEARVAGKKAYYRGPYGYIEGTRIVKVGWSPHPRTHPSSYCIGKRCK